MNRVRFACSIQPTAIGSSQVLAPRFPLRSSHGSSSSGMAPAESRRSRGLRLAARCGPRPASRLSGTKTSGSPVATRNSPGRSSLRPLPANIPRSFWSHGSGAENRAFILPFARFLVRRGMAVLGYDKRGVGGSTGDWQTASFDVLAGDVVAAFEYLKTRPDIDATQVGLLGVSQAGWVMPLAAVRARDSGVPDQHFRRRHLARPRRPSTRRRTR